MSITLSALQKQRRDSAANWTAENPTLLAGEIGIESDTGYWKVGDGSTAWTSLAYVSGLGAEIPVSRLADGTARQLLQTAANGNDVEWTSNVDIPGTLDVTGAATFDAAVTIQGDLTVNGTTTTIDTQNLIVEDKNVIIGQVTTPTDVTADGGGITLKGTTDKTINWVDATDAWTSSERFSVPLGTAGAPSLTFTGDPNTGIYSPGADQVAISTNGTGRLSIDANGNVAVDTNTLYVDAVNNRVAVGSASPAVKLDIAETGTNSCIVRVRNDSNAVYLDANNGYAYLNAFSNIPLLFGTNNLERARIDSSGRLLVGTSSAITGTGGITDGFQLGNTGALIGSYAANQFGNRIQFAKSRSATTGSQTVVQSGDTLGYLEWAGSDGTNFQLGARITAEVDGTPGANDMPGRLVFSTTADGASSPTERMRITSTGALLFNHVNAALPGVGNTNLGLTFEAPASGASVFISRDATCLYLNRNSDGGLQDFRRSGTSVGTITVTTTATAYNTSSDYRLKENVSPVTDGITRLQQLKPSRFNFIANPDKTVDGFLAHEAAEVVPECVTGEKDAVDDDGNPIYQGIDQSKLVPLLTAALQEAVAKIESLEARLTAAGI